MNSKAPLDDSDWWTREMYARFGLAVYFCQVLEVQLVNHLMAIRLGDGLDLAGIDRLLERWFSRPMGNNVANIKKEAAVSDSTATVLDQALKRRNWLVHHYFRSRTDKIATIAGQRTIVSELETICEEIQTADEILTAETLALMEKRGLSVEAVRAASEPFLAALYRGERPAGFNEWHDLFGRHEPS
jgi:hypothetical protein